MSFDHTKPYAGVDRRARLRRERADSTGDGGLEFVLHLHGFHDYQRGADLDLIALGREYADDPTGHGADEVSCGATARAHIQRGFERSLLPCAHLYGQRGAVHTCMCGPREPIQDDAVVLERVLFSDQGHARLSARDFISSTFDDRDVRRTLAPKFDLKFSTVDTNVEVLGGHGGILVHG